MVLFMILRCSETLTVADSPVVPTDTIPLVPDSICHSINASRAFGTKVTFEKMKQAAGVLTSVFGIVLYLLLREELRKYL